MKLLDVKELTFPRPLYEEWKAVVESSLKGKSVESLKTNTYEGIQLNPLYTDDVLSSEYPGLFPYTRGIYPAGYLEQPWLIVQPITGKNAIDANKKMKDALKRGQNVLTYTPDLFNEESNIGSLFEGLALDALPLFIDTKGLQSKVLKGLINACKKQGVTSRGVCAEDPISEWAQAGEIPSQTNAFFSQWFKEIKQYQEKSAQMKTVLIKTPVFHNAGANAVQEIAIGLSIAAYYIEEAQKQGLAVQDFVEKIVFSFALDSTYFMGIAKLRAARRLWAGMAEAYGANCESFKMNIHAVTSRVTETKYDEHVNLLRTANQAFAATIGGIQYLEIHPFSHASGREDPLADRIARNMHVILSEESQLASVVDPAGGSFYVEQLTNELAKKAWTAFLELDEAGGILTSLKEGRIQEQIKAVYKEKERNVALRKDSMIGTNVYPNPADMLKQSESAVTNSYLTIRDPIPIPPVSLCRLAEPFERIRTRSEAYKNNIGTSLKIGLLNLSEMKSYKLRADFIKGMLATGGIETRDSQGLVVEQDAIQFVEQSGIRVFCLCGSNDDYELYAGKIVTEIKRKYPATILYIAGQQSSEISERLKSEGVKDFITVETNVLEILAQLQLELGVIKHD
ncbi:methylmalonyl-CoA mutase family protein [Peribacillus sp. JNUCC 23]